MKKKFDINYLSESFSSDSTKVYLFCYLDIDNFHSYNISNGFEKGNLMLEKIKQIIKETRLNKSLVYSISDEFLFCFEGSFEKNQSQILLLLDRITKNAKITASIGATYSTKHCENVPFLFQTLKHNVWVSKHNGKNKIYLD